MAQAMAAAKRASRGSDLRRRARMVAARLGKSYPDAKCALLHSNALELLVATILSAQCTDARVNIVTKELFKKYRSATDYASASLSELESDIRSTGFFRNKAKSIQGAARMIAEKFGGRVPDRMDDLLLLPGVARKTGNVVLGTWFGKAEGVVVDTHVYRISQRLGLSKEKDPAKVERDLMALLRPEQWIDFSHRMIWHGRRICHARKPACEICPLRDICPSASTFHVEHRRHA